MAQATPLPNTLGDAVAKCQALLGDPSGQWVKRYYIVPFIQIAYSSMAKAIKNASGKNFEAVVEVLAVPPGTSDLSVYQKYDAPPDDKRGPLVGLFDPIRMWVKTAGQLPQYYVPAIGPRDTLPHTAPPGIPPAPYGTRVTFAWIGNKLSITPVAGAIDVQVYGRFNPPPLQADEDRLLLYDDMADTLAFLATAITGVERANPAVLQGYAQAGDAGVDNIVADIIRQCQKNPRRLAKLGGSGGYSYGWGSGV